MKGVIYKQTIEIMESNKIKIVCGGKKSEFLFQF